MRQALKRGREALELLRKEAKLANTSYPKIIWQAGCFFLKTGLGPRYYIVAGMARDDFPQTDKWLHISAAEYYKALDVLNPPAYRKLIQNRLCEKALYNVMHITTARMRGYYHPQKGITDYGMPLKNEEQLDDLLGSLKDQAICLKPVEGWRSHGVKVGKVAIRQGMAVLELMASDEVLDATAIIAAYQSAGTPVEFIIEDRLRQSSQFAAFNPDSFNILRLWVLCDANSNISVLGGYLRVGRTASAIANASAGNLMCPIDVATGRIGRGITKHGPHRDNFTVHPDHGTRLSGEVIEHWQEIYDFACGVLNRIPHTRFAGLDIGMTPDGPVLLEASPDPDKNEAAYANIPAIRLEEAAQALTSR